MPKIDYTKPDNVITFDKTSSVYLTGTNHAENQPVHLQLKDSNLPINYTLEKFDEPAQRYCPVGVYEVQIENNLPKFIEVLIVRFFFNQSSKRLSPTFSVLR